MKHKFFILFYFLLLAAPAIYGQAYKGIVENFYNALGNRDFAGAYNLCSGTQWGTLAQFSSNNMYGGIYEVAYSPLKYKKQTAPNMAEVEIDIFVKDSVNGDGRFIQNFALVKKQNQWLIQRISLLQTDRAEKGWNLKLVDQAGLTSYGIEELVQPIYDTLGSGRTMDKAERTLQRKISEPKFFQMPGGVYAVAVAENRLQGPAAIGWCDAFVFRQKDTKWVMTDFKLKAGGGGMYGNSGEFKNLLQVGDSVAGLVIAGGQMHMGDLLEFDDILAIENGKLYNMVSIATYHRYGEFGSDYEKDAKVCDMRSYRFIRSDKRNYDLQIIYTSCLASKKGKEMGRIVIPCINRKYELP